MNVIRESYFEKTLNGYDNHTKAVVEDIIKLAKVSVDINQFIQQAKDGVGAKYGIVAGEKTLQINGAFIIFSETIPVGGTIMFNAVSLGPVYADRHNSIL